MHKLITSTLDYCHDLLYSSAKYPLYKMQPVPNASARRVYCPSKSCHITPLLCELQWLLVYNRIRYKIIVIFKILHGMVPEYLSNSISISPPIIKDASFSNFQSGVGSCVVLLHFAQWLMAGLETRETLIYMLMLFLFSLFLGSSTWRQLPSHDRAVVLVLIDLVYLRVCRRRQQKENGQLPSRNRRSISRKGM